MELTKSSMQSLVDKIKRESLFSKPNNQNFLLSPSPYDIAWLALVPDPHDPTRPMFENCLGWILQNQTRQGFWAADGDAADTAVMTMDCLPATLACLVALKRWKVAPNLINKGLRFLHGNHVEELLIREKLVISDVPRWFTIMFPAMLELAKASGLQVTFPENLHGTLEELFRNRDDILLREELADKHQYSPLLMFLEALPLPYDIDDLKQCLDNNLSSDGSLFQSPSATARAYMVAGNTRCLSYLESLSKSCADGGVPSFYPVDGELQELIIVNQLLMSGLSEHFVPEIEELLLRVRQIYENKIAPRNSIDNIAAELYKDSLAFWLLRINGHSVSPSIFCWFLHDKEIRDHIEMNYREFATVLLNVYRAAELMFSGELELGEARSFARKYLDEKLLTHGNPKRTTDISSSLQRMIEHELRLPWTARMDHLEHRMWIEETASSALWMGKSSYHRLSCLHSADLQELALKNYILRQSVYRNELEEVKSWSKERGLSDMGFGREKTTYCYFAFAASTCLPCNSSIRKILTKAAVVITVADDFFDIKGSLDDLENLTDAVRRWDIEGLSSHSKTIYEALDDLVYEVRERCFQQHGKDIKGNLQHLWYETFNSWLTEAKWGRRKSKPSVDKYLRNAMTSIAAHTMVLPASCLLGRPGFPIHQLWSVPPDHHQGMTSLLMVTTRLLNDIQSYLKEEEEGKINYVWLYMDENQEAKIDDSIQHVQALLSKMKKEFLEHVLSDEDEQSSRDHLPKSFKQLHLSCFKVFNMFFNSSNLYDSDEAELLHDINKALFSPPHAQKFKTLNKSPPPLITATLILPPSHDQPREVVKKRHPMVTKTYCTDPSPVNKKIYPWKVFSVQHPISRHGTMNRVGNINFAASNMKLCFN